MADPAYLGQEGYVVEAINAFHSPATTGAHMSEHQGSEKAIQVLPHLYIGATAAAKDTKQLEALGITMLLYVHNKEDDPLITHRIQEKTKTDAQEWRAMPVSTAIQLSDVVTTIKAVHIHMTAARNYHEGGTSRASEPGALPGRKVLLFDISGMDVAPGILVGYIMGLLKADEDKAKTYLMTRKNRINKIADLEIPPGISDLMSTMVLGQQADKDGKRAGSPLPTTQRGKIPRTDDTKDGHTSTRFPGEDSASGI